MFYSIKTIEPIARDLHAQKLKLILATGFFDLLHSEHLNFLQKAKAAGDVLIVAVESDERARILKGEGRPIQTQSIRLKNLIPHADYLLALDATFNNPLAFENLIQAVQPAFLAVSSHTAHLDKKQAMLKKNGSDILVVHNHNPDISTTILYNQSTYV